MFDHLDQLLSVNRKPIRDPSHAIITVGRGFITTHGGIRILNSVTLNQLKSDGAPFSSPCSHKHTDVDSLKRSLHIFNQPSEPSAVKEVVNAVKWRNASHQGAAHANKVPAELIRSNESEFMAH